MSEKQLILAVPNTTFVAQDVVDDDGRPRVFIGVSMHTDGDVCMAAAQLTPHDARRLYSYLGGFLHDRTETA